MNPLLLSLCLAAASPPPRVAVMDLEPSGATPELAAAVGGAVANELQRIGVFKVTSADSVRAILSLERRNQLLGAGEGGISQLSEALGVDYALHGQVSHVGKAGQPEAFTLELVLDEAHTGKREGSDVERAATAPELLSLVGKAVSKTVASLLAHRTGQLVVTASEAGATVKVDDSVVGSTPLSGAVVLPAGPHQLVIDKAGFISLQKDIRLQPDRLSEETVTLVPSQDYIDEHQGRAAKMRLGAWIGTGVAAAGLATAAIFQVRADRFYGAVGKPNTFLDDRARLAAGDESYRPHATSLQTQINSSQTLSFVAAGVGVAAGVAAAYFWIAGEDPGRYTRFKSVTQVAVVPAPGGGAVVAGLTF